MEGNVNKIIYFEKLIDITEKLLEKNCEHYNKY